MIKSLIHKIDNGKINLISNISSKIKIKLGYWNEIDDIKIFNGLKKHHSSWISIKNDLPERTRISLRNRFINSIKKLNKGGRFERINQFLFENVYFTLGKSIKRFYLNNYLFKIFKHFYFKKLI